MLLERELRVAMQVAAGADEKVELGGSHRSPEC
jgi:hypothetical protein